MTPYRHIPACFFRLPAVAAWAALAASGSAALAQEPAAQALYIGGSQGSSAGTYTYAGQIAPLEGARVGQGWFRKHVASWLTYRYDTEVGGTPIRARAGAAGFETGWGYAWDTDRFKGDVSLGLGVRHTHLRPVVARADGEHGTRVTLTPQVAARYLFTPQWDASVLASYSLGARSSFARARTGVQPGGSPWRLGVEASLSQGRDYRTQQVGAFAGRPVGTGWFVEVNAGHARPKDGKDSPYVGVSLSLVK